LREQHEAVLERKFKLQKVAAAWIGRVKASIQIKRIHQLIVRSIELKAILRKRLWAI
jgi:hypothetical protein